jgi:hypothetical protein
MIAWGVIIWGLLAGVQDPPVPGSAEAEADAAIATFKRSFYRPNSTEDELVLAVRTLGETAHAKTLAVLAPIITDTKVPVSSRIAAALVLSKFGKVDGAPQALIKAYQSTGRHASLRPVRIQIILSMGELKAEAGASLVNLAMFDNDPWIARAAVKSAGKIRGAWSIDPLIKRLQVLESRDGEKSAEVPDPSKREDGIDRHQKTERQVLQAPIHDALNSITRQRHTCAETWAKWWAQNRKDYKVPP